MLLFKYSYTWTCYFKPKAKIIFCGKTLALLLFKSNKTRMPVISIMTYQCSGSSGQYIRIWNRKEAKKCHQEQQSALIICRWLPFIYSLIHQIYTKSCLHIPLHSRAQKAKFTVLTEKTGGGRVVRQKKTREMKKNVPWRKLKQPVKSQRGGSHSVSGQPTWGRAIWLQPLVP